MNVNAARLELGLDAIEADGESSMLGTVALDHRPGDGSFTRADTNSDDVVATVLAGARTRDGRLAFVGQVEDYAHRAPALSSLCPYFFIMLYRKTKIDAEYCKQHLTHRNMAGEADGADEENAPPGASGRAKARFALQAGHPQCATHMHTAITQPLLPQRMCEVPVLPDADALTEAELRDAREAYATFALGNFASDRHPIMAAEHACMWDRFCAWKALVGTEPLIRLAMHVLNNVDLRQRTRDRHARARRALLLRRAQLADGRRAAGEPGCTSDSGGESDDDSGLGDADEEVAVGGVDADDDENPNELTLEARKQNLDAAPQLCTLDMLDRALQRRSPGTHV